MPRRRYYPKGDGTCDVTYEGTHGKGYKPKTGMRYAEQDNIDLDDYLNGLDGIPIIEDDIIIRK